MGIIGIGIDIVEIKRIDSVMLRHGNNFARRILSYKEFLKYKKHKQPVRFIAKRFAAKEAAAKAFGIGISKGITFTQLEVLNDNLGKPVLRIFEKALVIAKKIGLKKINLTLADERYYACAMVIFEK